LFVWRVWRYQRGNQNPYIKEKQKNCKLLSSWLSM